MKILIRGQKDNDWHLVESAAYVNESELHKYRSWSSIRDRKNNDDFVNLDDLISKYQLQLRTKTNVMWTHIIELLEEISKTDTYKKMAIIFEERDRGVTILFTESQRRKL